MNYQDFAGAWIADWNAHDLDRILAHYAEDIVFSSPNAQRLTGEGVVRGIPALRSYWALGLAARPRLHFELEELFAGHECLTLVFRGENGGRVAETLQFDAAGKIECSSACYA